MLIMIVHSCGNVIPYNVISDVTTIREIEGTHIPLPAKSNRERSEVIQNFINGSLSNPDQIFLLVVNEELSEVLNLEKDGGIDVVLYCYLDNNGKPAVSVDKNGIGDEGVTYEEFQEDLRNYTPAPLKTRYKTAA